MLPVGQHVWARGDVTGGLTERSALNPSLVERHGRPHRGDAQEERRRGVEGDDERAVVGRRNANVGGIRVGAVGLCAARSEQGVDALDDAQQVAVRVGKARGDQSLPAIDEVLGSDRCPVAVGDAWLQRERELGEVLVVGDRLGQCRLGAQLRREVHQAAMQRRQERNRLRVLSRVRVHRRRVEVAQVHAETPPGSPLGGVAGGVATGRRWGRPKGRRGSPGRRWGRPTGRRSGRRAGRP